MGWFFLNRLLFGTRYQYKDKRDWLWIIEQHIRLYEPNIEFKEFDDIFDLIDDLRDNDYSDEHGHQRFFSENPPHLITDYGIDAVCILKEYVYGIRNRTDHDSIEVYLGDWFFSDSFNLIDITMRRGEFKDFISELKPEE